MRYLILILVFLSHFSAGQNLVIKKNGKVISCKKVYLLEGHIEIRDENKEWLKIPNDELEGYFDESTADMMVLIPVTRNKLNIVGLQSKNEITETVFAKEVVTGKISLYETQVLVRMTSSPSMDGLGNKPSPIMGVQYYARKDDHFEKVWDEYENDRSNYISFISDDTLVLNTVKHRDFSFTKSQFVKLTEIYNVRNFEKVSASYYTNTGEVAFYIPDKGLMKENLLVQINDSLEFRFQADKASLVINLPLNVASKICVTSATAHSCEIVRSVPSRKQFFEITYHNGKT